MLSNIFSKKLSTTVMPFMIFLLSKFLNFTCIKKKLLIVGEIKIQELRKINEPFFFISFRFQVLKSIIKIEKKKKKKKT